MSNKFFLLVRRNSPSKFNWSVFCIAATISVMSLVSLCMSEEDNSFFANLFWGGISFTVSQGIAIGDQLLKKTGLSDCAYERYLKDMGVICIYKNREDQKHIDDLLSDLKSLSLASKETIKMIGVALIFYFQDDVKLNTYKIAMEIKKQSKRHNFRALVSSTDNNPELLRRNEFTQKMDFIIDRLGENKIDIIKDINATKEIISNWELQEKDNIARLKKKSRKESNVKNQATEKQAVDPPKIQINLLKYSGAPYATIVCINDHVYYTPNMPYEKKRRGINENDENPNPTLCIMRKSELGKKLEKSFDLIWNDSTKI